MGRDTDNSDQVEYFKRLSEVCKMYKEKDGTFKKGDVIKRSLFIESALKANGLFLWYMMREEPNKEKEDSFDFKITTTLVYDSHQESISLVFDNLEQAPSWLTPLMMIRHAKLSSLHNMLDFPELQLDDIKELI